MVFHGLYHHVVVVVGERPFSTRPGEALPNDGALVLVDRVGCSINV